MQIPLNSHILYVEHRLQELRTSLTIPRISNSERSRIEAQIKVATEALREYRHANWLEHLIRADDPNLLLAKGA